MSAGPSGASQPPGRVRSIVLLVICQTATVSVWFAGSAATSAALSRSSRPDCCRPPCNSDSSQERWRWRSADRFDPRRVFAVAALVCAASTAALTASGLAGPAAVLLLAVTGVALAGVYPISMKLVAGWSRSALGLPMGLLVSNRLAKVADQIEKWDAASPYRMSRAGGSPISVFIDGAYIRAVPGYQSRHFEIAMGRVVSPGRQPRQFAAAPNVATGKHDVVRAAMRAQGWLPGRDVTVFSDGDVGLQGIVISATRQPVTHILDWFHLSMRLRHIEQAWEGLRHVGDLNIHLRDVAVDVPRLRHLLWSGYVREATRAVKNMLYQLEQHARLRDASHKLKRLYVLIGNLQTYLVQNATSIVDYCHRYWSGEPISSSPAESAANSLVNARMNKKRQMRWSPVGAHRVLQVRAAVADGRLKQAKFDLAA